MKNLNHLELATNHLQKIVGYVLMKFLICQHMKATVSCIRMTRCINRSVSKDRAFGFTRRKIYVKSKCAKQESVRGLSSTTRSSFIVLGKNTTYKKSTRP